MKNFFRKSKYKRKTPKTKVSWTFRPSGITYKRKAKKSYKSFKKSKYSRRKKAVANEIGFQKLKRRIQHSRRQRVRIAKIRNIYKKYGNASDFEAYITKRYGDKYS